MKTTNTFSLLFSFLFLMSIVVSAENETTKKTMPDDVKAVVEKSCFGCHNTNSKNEDGKEALDFKKLDKLSKIQMISAYKEIGDVVEEGDMPPKKFLQKYPDKKLTDADKKILLDWSKKEAEALVKGQ